MNCRPVKNKRRTKTLRETCGRIVYPFPCLFNCYYRSIAAHLRVNQLDVTTISNRKKIELRCTSLLLLLLYEREKKRNVSSFFCCISCKHLLLYWRNLNDECMKCTNDKVKQITRRGICRVSRL
jgi:hypothetical protein